MLTTIVNIQPKDTAGGGGETRETIVYRLSDDMLEKLPENYLGHEVFGQKTRPQPTQQPIWYWHPPPTHTHTKKNPLKLRSI